MNPLFRRFKWKRKNRRKLYNLIRCTIVYAFKEDQGEGSLMSLSLKHNLILLLCRWQGIRVWSTLTLIIVPKHKQKE